MSGVYTLIVGAEKNGAIDYRGELPSGELLTASGTAPTITVAEGVTIENVAINDSAVEVFSSDVPAGKALTFTAIAETAGTYEFTAIAYTDATNPQKLLVRGTIVVVD